MGFIHGAGEEPILPEMPAAVVETIENLRVTEVGSSNGFLETVCLFRYGHDVDVVGHKAVANDVQSMSTAFFFQESQVGGSVQVGEEYILLVIAPLSNVMRFPGYYDSCCACHGLTLLDMPAGVNNQMTVPGFPLLASEFDSFFTASAIPS